MIKFNPKKVSRRIRLGRSALGLTQADLARACRIGRSLLSRYESGEYLPGTKVLFELSQQLGTSAGWLIGLED